MIINTVKYGNCTFKLRYRYLNWFQSESTFEPKIDFDKPYWFHVNAICQSSVYKLVIESRKDENNR